MERLGALISPALDDWYADKLQAPQVQLRCLPLRDRAALEAGAG